MNNVSHFSDYQELFQSLPERYFVILADDPKFTIVDFNHDLSAISDAKRDQFIGKSFFEIFPDVSEKYKQSGISDLTESFRRVIKTKKPDTIEMLRYDVPAGKDGTFITRYWQPTHSPILGKDGKVRYIVQSPRDITDQRRAEKALRQQLAFTNTITKSLGEGVYIVDNKARLTFMNVAAQTMLGWKESELLGKSLHEIIHFQRADGSFAPAKDCRLRSVLLSGKDIVNNDDVFTRKDGTMFPISYTSAPILQDGEVMGSVLAFADITTRKKLEDDLRSTNERLETRVRERTRQLEEANATLKRSNQELQDFAYIASHDLQEPLRKIRAFGNLLETEHGSKLGAGNDYLHRMQNAAMRMSTLIQDLLEFSRVTTQAQPFLPIDLNVIAKEVINDLEGRIRETQGTVVVKNLPIMEADPIQMRQLFQNLIGNALKFHKDDVPPEVVLWSEPQYDINGTLQDYQIKVSDNGIGFSEKYLDRIFAVFQRLHSRDSYEGTGIGLAVCRKIAERHNGTITATSTPGEGATFIITLRRAKN